MDSTTILRDAGLRVTKQRTAVIAALFAQPHASTQLVLDRVRHDVGSVSTQAIYDVLGTLTEHGVARRIQPAGSVPRYELRTGDNHHHLVCRECSEVVDIDCATGEAPCLDADDLQNQAPGFIIDEAEITFWGLCARCAPIRPEFQTDRTKHGGKHGN